MYDYKDGLEILCRAAKARQIKQKEQVGLQEAQGRICSNDIKAPIANQPFDNSAMDGYALRAQDIKKASDENPVDLSCRNEIVAGDSDKAGAIAHGQCIRIMTGAPVPEGCDVVVPVENTEEKDKHIVFTHPAREGANIRLAGEDYQKGDNVLSKSDLIESSHILPLATLGIHSVSVLRKLKVALISTGKELVTDMNSQLGPGKIYNSNGPYLSAMIRNFGAELIELGAVPDDLSQYKNKISQAREQKADLILSTGAVSAGVHDFVPSVLKEMGAQILFHKCKIRPAKPILGACFEQDGPMVIGLPGNPVSAASGYRFFAVPVMRFLLDLPQEEPVRARLDNAYHKRKSDFTFFLKARHYIDDVGQTRVEILPGQESFKTAPFTKMTCWAVGEAGRSDLGVDELIDIYPL